MPNYLQDDAICLHVTDFSETSQIVALFTRRHGLIPLIAKGAKRQSKNGPSGKFSGPLDLLTAGEVIYVPSKGTSELSTLAAWELVDHRAGLRTSLHALNAAVICAELSLLLLHPHDPHEELFANLEAALQLLPTMLRARALVSYAKAALTVAGYAPRMDACVSCGTPIQSAAETVRFSPAVGGIICASCPSGGEAIFIPGKIAVALTRLPLPAELLKQPPEKAGDPVALRVALLVLLAQVETVTGKPVKTRELLSRALDAAQIELGAPPKGS